ncbi:5-dehydro-4-deoxyglucarate dehydratase [Roseovarius sp. MBR-154]|jgi:5-dehydro-4-deoxyglucarate dehydratase
MPLTPDELKSRLASGLLSFPVTDFDATGAFDAASYSARLDWLASYPAAGLFAAGGTGEYFSITPEEYPRVIAAAIAGRQSDVPVIAGVGMATRIACEQAKTAEALGADGILVLPHYLTEATEEGIANHLRAICAAVDIGVIFYARSVSRLGVGTLLRLAEDCPNLIGYKDGVGDLQSIVQITTRLGERFTYLGGLPTAEVFAQAYLEIGVDTYSSAVFNFVPEFALAFFGAVRARDKAAVRLGLSEFFLPLLDLRDRKKGYAVSMIKAGAALVGHPAGAVRPPLTELDPDERDRLRELIEVAGRLVPRLTRPPAK